MGLFARARGFWLCAVDGVQGLSDVAPTVGIYVLRLAGDLIVKRVQKMPSGRFLLLSANPAYVPVEVDPARELDFAVVGRVVWFGRQV